MKPTERINLIDDIAIKLQESYNTSQINSLLSGYGLNFDKLDTVNSKKTYVRDIIGSVPNSLLLKIAADLGLDVPNNYNQLYDSHLNHSPTISKRKVFISHSTLDKDIVEPILDLIRAVGVNRENIFCTSVQGYGIPLGQDFLDVLKKELSNNVLVLFILSPNFYNSAVSLCEMGAAWISTKEHIPILIPPFSFNEVKGVFPNSQGFILDDKRKLNALKESLEVFFDLNPLKHSYWERERDDIFDKIIQRISNRNTYSPAGSSL